MPVEEDQVVFSPEKATHKDVETMNSTSCKEAEARTVTLRSGEEGIGIVRFLGGKNFLITGATGFLAKGINLNKHFSSIAKLPSL